MATVETPATPTQAAAPKPRAVAKISASKAAVPFTLELDQEHGVFMFSGPITGPAPSKSGKTLLVATTNGNIPTTANIGGKPVIVGFNAYVKA